MANICTNMFYASSEDTRNIKVIMDFIKSNLDNFDNDYSDFHYECNFYSKWVFPEDIMNTLFGILPNKSDIYMRCLAYEFGELYHALFICDENGWHES